MKILVIGGSRFVGPYIIDLLLKHKHAVTVFNRGLISGKYDSKVKFIRGDRNDGFSINQRFDAVIDTCAYTGDQTEKALKEIKFDYFLNFSTVAVYKSPITFPVKEDAPIGGIAAFGDYGIGKAGCEKVLKKTDIKYANIRPTYILGPKNYVDRENFIYSRLNEKVPIIIPGNGEAVVQFVFAPEVAKSIVFLTENKLTGSFNCAGDDLITLNGLIKSMAHIAKVKPVIKYNPKNDGANHDELEFPFANDNSIYSNEKIKKLGITFTPLLKGLERDYINFYKNTVSK